MGNARLDHGDADLLHARPEFRQQIGADGVAAVAQAEVGHDIFCGSGVQSQRALLKCFLHFD